MIPLQTDIKVVDSAIIVTALIVLNVVIFLIASGVASPDAWAHRYGLVPVIFTSWLFDGGAAPRVITFFTLLTNQFMHGGVWHLVINAWGLWLFGRPLEDRLGAGRFLTLYFLSGFMANFAHIAVFPDSGAPVIGASGAIAGVIGAFVMTWPRARVFLAAPILLTMFALPAAIFAFIWIGLDLLSGAFNLLYPERGGGGIAHWAHIGGFVTGLITIRFLRGSSADTLQIGNLREAQLEIGPSLDRRQILMASEPACEATPRETPKPAVRALSNFLNRGETLPAPIQEAAASAEGRTNTQGPWGRRGHGGP